jgi:multisubunit Na+/H+ antiporter MnhC subunit
VAVAPPVRIVLALPIAESGANLLLVLTGFRWNAVAPIIEGGAGPMRTRCPRPRC